MLTTGEIVHHDQIVEIGVIVTDANLQNMIRGPNFIVFCPDFILYCMNKEYREALDDRHLTLRVKGSKVAMDAAEAQILHFLAKECGLKKGTCPMIGGNLVHLHKDFLYEDMMDLYTFLGPKTIDISSVK